jgi:hypothetical protein
MTSGQKTSIGPPIEPGQDAPMFMHCKCRVISVMLTTSLHTQVLTQSTL